METFQRRFTQNPGKFCTPIDKKLVELHGGQIQVYSEGENKGSEFVVYLPLIVDEIREDNKLPVSIPNLVTHENHKVLLIDDNEDVVDSVSVWLKLEGYEVKVAHNGTEGISLVQNFKPEVVVIDIGLPDMDGYQVAKRIRDEIDTSHLLLIALSGYAGDLNSPTLKKESSFDYYLLKPPDLIQLQALIHEYFHSKTK